MKIETVAKERKLLKKIIKLSKNNPELKVTYEQLNLNEDDYYLKSLLNKELVWNSSIGHKKDGFGSPIYDSYMPSPEGLHFFEKRTESVKSFFYRSIFTPIIVSALTTLLTIFVKSLIK